MKVETIIPGMVWDYEKKKIYILNTSLRDDRELQLI